MSVANGKGQNQMIYLNRIWSETYDFGMTKWHIMSIFGQCSGMKITKSIPFMDNSIIIPLGVSG